MNAELYMCTYVHTYAKCVHILHVYTLMKAHLYVCRLSQLVLLTQYPAVHDFQRQVFTG